jgi:hypothetical protein
MHHLYGDDAASQFVISEGTVPNRLPLPVRLRESYNQQASLADGSRRKGRPCHMSGVSSFVFVVLVTIIVSILGLTLVRRKVPTSRLAQLTDVAGYIYAVIGVIYAVMLALVVVAAWEEYRDAQAGVDDEASAVLNLARMANGWSAGDRANVEAALIAYARQVVEVEWPAMTRGDFAPTTDSVAVNRVWQALNMARDAATMHGESYEVALLQLDKLDEARRERLLLGQDGLPMALAVILIIGAVVTVAFSYLFAVDDGQLHAVMTASLAVLVSLLLLLQFQLGRPFQGISAIGPTAMELVLAEIDSGSGIPGMNP